MFDINLVGWIPCGRGSSSDAPGSRSPDLQPAFLMQYRSLIRGEVFSLAPPVLPFAPVVYSDRGLSPLIPCLHPLFGDSKILLVGHRVVPSLFSTYGHLKTFMSLANGVFITLYAFHFMVARYFCPR